MKLKRIELSPYDFTYSHGYRRLGALLKLESDDERLGIGDLAPLRERSKESLSEALEQFQKIQEELLSLEWNKNTFLEQLQTLHLFPSLAFALESALFSILHPPVSYSLDVAALVTGHTLKQILDVSHLRKKEGFKTIKLKIGNLSLEDAFTAINELKDLFKLRIDANSRWSLAKAISFFSKFSEETFDYIEDPVSTIDELRQFPYPLVVEELVSKGISLSMLTTIPRLKAVTYKPTVQGGVIFGKELKKWTDSQGIDLVLSSSLESDEGHFHLVATAGRIGLTAPLGIGTYHYLNRYTSKNHLKFEGGKVII